VGRIIPPPGRGAQDQYLSERYLSFFNEALSHLINQIGKFGGRIAKPRFVNFGDNLPDDDAQLTKRWKNDPTVLAYLWGEVTTNKRTGRDVLRESIFVGNIRPRSFTSVKVVLREDAWENVFILAYALMWQAYLDRKYENALAIETASRYLIDQEGIERRGSWNSCLQQLLVDMGRLRQHAEQAQQSGRPPTEFQSKADDPLSCNRK
jgi:hypothetical protein